MSDTLVMEKEPETKQASNDLVISFLPHINAKCSTKGLEFNSKVDASSFLSLLKSKNAKIVPLLSDSQQNDIKDPSFDPSLYFRIIAPEENLQKIGEELITFHSNIIDRVYNYSPVFSDPAIKLQYASSFYWSGAGSAGRAVTFDINVKNEPWLANAGKVFLHYNPKNNGPWLDYEVPLLSRCGNFAAFRLSTEKFFFVDDFEFCLKFIEPNGTVHWDNNNWSNYILPYIDSSIMLGNIQLVSADIVSYDMPGWMNCTHIIVSGKLIVRDLAYEKNVGIRYCIDGKTWKNASAHWVSNKSNGIQNWEFSLGEYPSGYPYPEFRFALYYEDLPTHNWYWDNNFENDYRLQYGHGDSVDQHID